MVEALDQQAAHLKRLVRLSRAAHGLEVWQLTDPERLPAGFLAELGPLPVTGVIVRHYGLLVEIEDGLEVSGARALSAPVPDALIMPGPYGVHWPSAHLKARRRSHRLHRSAETASAHSSREIARALKAGIPRILISPVFASDSPSAGRPLGAVRLAALVRRFPAARLIALGGVSEAAVAQVRRTGASGAAGVSWRRVRRRL